MRISKAYLVWLLLAALMVGSPPVVSSHNSSEGAATQPEVPDDQKEPFELIMA